MISLETAKALRDAGLLWEPKKGDWFQFGERKNVVYHGPVSVGNNPETATYYDDVCPAIARNRRDLCVWLPRLDQLLGEIEERNFWAGVFPDRPGLWECVLYKMHVILNELTEVFPGAEFKAPTPEEAAGRALLWVLERSVIE